MKAKLINFIFLLSISITFCQTKRWTCSKINPLQNLDINKVTGEWYVLEVYNNKNTTLPKNPWCPHFKISYRNVTGDEIPITWTIPKAGKTDSLSTFYAKKNENLAVWYKPEPSGEAVAVVHLSNDENVMVLASCAKGIEKKGMMIAKSYSVTDLEKNDARNKLQRGGTTSGRMIASANCKKAS